MLSMKHLSTIALCLTGVVGMSAYAAQPGFYVGGQMGWGNVTQTGISSGEMGQLISGALNDSNYTTTTFRGASNGNGFAWRVFGGYQVGYHFAAEMGWTVFPHLPIDARATGIDLDTGQPFVAGTKGTFKTSAFDLVGKYIFPLPCQFNVYGKLGLAFVVGNYNESVTLSEPGLTSTADDDGTTNRLYPTAGIGLGYDFRPDISADLSYSRIQKVGNSEQLGSINVVLLALILHFG